MEMTSAPWGELPDGRKVEAYTIRNGNGMSMTVVTYGATVVSVTVPRKGAAAAAAAGGGGSGGSGGGSTGDNVELTLCHRTLGALTASSPYYGATVGRVANRIAKGAMTVDGKAYGLATNNGPNHLHGGVVGYDKVVWAARVHAAADAAGVTFSYNSHDGEEGYPGSLAVTADYTLTAANEIVMTFTATAGDKATPVNLCNHTYWNLSGDCVTGIKDHTLHLPTAAHVVAVDAEQIPTGVLAPVAGTPFDFLAPRRIGERLAEVDGGSEKGYDHCFSRLAAGAADASASMPLDVIAVLVDPASGRRMTVRTTAPGVQVYSGNFLSKEPAAAPHTQYGALCLETCNFPDAVNKAATAGFPSPILPPHATYKHVAAHAFEW